MWKVRGVKINGCTFENSNPSATTISELGMGIYTIDAAYKIDNSCANSIISPCPTSDIIKSQFIRLNYGVKSDKIETNNTYSIKNAIFSNCATSLLNNGVNSSELLFNRFEYKTPYTPIPSGTGIFFNTGTGYKIEENVFTSTLPSPFQTVGAYMVNTGVAPNQIYKNTFTSLLYGAASVGQNRDQQGARGLQFLCNTFTGGILTDIYSKTITGAPYNGARTNQGESAPTTLAAGNKFSTIVPGGFNIRNNSGWAMNYYYGSGLNEYPTVITNNVIRYSANNNTCPSNSGSGQGSQSAAMTTALENLFYTERTAETDLRNQLKTLIDGGNTTTLSSQVENSWPNETWQLRTNLLSKSPYLSEEVLAEAREKSLVLPNPILFEIYRANPDGLNSDELLKKLSEKPDPMLEWMIDTLRDVRKIQTYRSGLEGLIAFHSAFKDQIGNEIIKSILSDTNGIDHVRLQTWLANMNTVQTDIMAINDYCQTGNYQTAKVILDNLPSKFDLKDYGLKEYETFADLFGNLKGFYDNSKTIYQLDSTEINKIKEIADNGIGVGQIYAQNICRIYGYEYEPIINLQGEDIPIKSHSKNTASGTSIDVNEEYVKIYPSPAKEWVLIKWNLLSNDNITNVEVTNSLGVNQTAILLEALEGEKIIDTREWNAGIYYFKAMQGGKIIQTGKIVISR